MQGVAQIAEANALIAQPQRADQAYAELVAGHAAKTRMVVWLPVSFAASAHAPT